MYEYKATAISVYDGDTVTLDIDLGLHVHVVAICRIAHINAPELKDAGGAAARDRVRELLQPMGKSSPPLVVRTKRDRTEKYGRWLAEIELPSGDDLGELLVAEEHARAYEGGRR